MGDDALKNPPPLVTPPTEATAAASADAKPTYTHDEVEAIVASFKTPSAPPDPLAKFRAAVGAAKPEQKQAQQGQDALLQSVNALLALQVANMTPPRPPAPPKPMSVDEKLSSTDPSTWLGRDPNTSITPQDRAVILQRHTAKLTAENFRGNIEAEANARTAREISTAFTRACGGIKVAVGATNETAALLEAMRRGR